MTVSNDHRVGEARYVDAKVANANSGHISKGVLWRDVQCSRGEIASVPFVRSSSI